MTFPAIHAPSPLTRAALALALGLALAACGGGTDVDPPGVTSVSSTAGVMGVSPAAAAAGWVTVGGCVLDRHYLPTTGTPVRVLASDGRLLGHAHSDRQGRFTLRLPAQSNVTLQVDRPAGESLPMRVDAAATTWTKCLLDDNG